MPDVYISADIEADGPIPGCYSMLSFGFAVAGRFDGATFEAFEPEAKTFSRELRPISDEAHTAALAVSGLDRERLRHEGADPAEAMRAAAAWVAMQSEGVIGDDVLLSRRPPETTSESRPPLRRQLRDDGHRRRDLHGLAVAARPSGSHGGVP